MSHVTLPPNARQVLGNEASDAVEREINRAFDELNMKTVSAMLDRQAPLFELNRARMREDLLELRAYMDQQLVHLDQTWRTIMDAHREHANQMHQELRKDNSELKERIARDYVAKFVATILAGTLLPIMVAVVLKLLF